MTEHKQQMGEIRNECQMLLRNTKRWDQSQYGRIVLKLYSRKYIDYCGQDSIAEIYGPVVGCCEKIMPIPCL